MSRVGPEPRLVVFDVDGTLVDSRRILMAVCQESFEAIGLVSPSYDEVRQIVGLSLADGLARLAPDLSPEQIEGLRDAYRRSFHDQHLSGAASEPLYDGAAELLDRLRAEGWRVAMATGKSRRGVDAIIAMHGWADLFDSTHCADDGPGKPHPAMLLAAMEALQTPPGRTAMIGDTAFDMQMAKAAGAHALGVSWGFHTADEVAAGGADRVCETFEELGRELDRLAAGWS